MSRPLGIFSPFRLPLLRADERRALFCLDNDDRGCHGAALSVVVIDTFEVKERQGVASDGN